MQVKALWAIIVALSHEAKAILSGMAVQSHTRYGPIKIYEGSFAGRECLLVQTGIGPRNAEQASRFLLDYYPVTHLISTGYCGALKEGIKNSEVVLATSLLSLGGNLPPLNPDHGFFAEIKERLGRAGFAVHCGPMVTSERPVLKREDKMKLGTAAGAIAVDMESYFVLKAAQESKKIVSLAMRFVVDALDDDLADTASFVDAQSGFQPMSLLREAIRQPKILMELPGLERQAGRARKKMSAAVQSIFK
jgi:nucleoside phosphorylase